MSKPPLIVRGGSFTSVRDRSADASAPLRTWRLGKGNLVYNSAGMAASGALRTQPLIVMLRAFFDYRTQPKSELQLSNDPLPTISATDALDAMRALGISPPTMPDGRPLHRFPFEVTGRSRVTFAQLCRAVQVSSPARHTAPRVHDAIWPSNTQLPQYPFPQSPFVHGSVYTRGSARSDPGDST